MCDATERGEMFDPHNSACKVLGIDIGIRSHNCETIKAHPLFPRIEMIEGSSLARETVVQVRKTTSAINRSWCVSIPTTPMITLLRKSGLMRH